jgi:hypothetical protein
MKTIRRAVGSTVVVALLGLALLPGCSRSPKAEAPSSAPEAAPAAGLPNTSGLAAKEAEAEPTTLADAEALLEKARADLDRLALNEPGVARGATGGGPSPASAPPSPSPSPSPPRAEAKRADKATSADEAAAPPAKEVNPCETACKAFSSLIRASDAVCRLDTDGGKRCERARQIREDASHRVASCGCAK